MQTMWPKFVDLFGVTLQVSLVWYIEQMTSKTPNFRPPGYLSKILCPIFQKVFVFQKMAAILNFQIFSKNTKLSVISLNFQTFNANEKLEYSLVCFAVQDRHSDFKELNILLLQCFLQCATLLLYICNIMPTGNILSAFLPHSHSS